MINERKHITAAFNRFNTNDKFSMCVNQPTNDTSMTNIDQMYEYLWKCNNDITSTSVNKLRTYIETEEFDTETLQTDIDSVEDGNISIHINDEQVMEAILNFIRAVSLQSSSFNVGCTFYYWG
eukprot:384782_1